MGDAPWHQRIADHAHRRACRHNARPVTRPALADDDHRVGGDHLGLVRHQVPQLGAAVGDRCERRRAGELERRAAQPREQLHPALRREPGAESRARRRDRDPPRAASGRRARRRSRTTTSRSRHRRSAGSDPRAMPRGAAAIACRRGQRALDPGSDGRTSSLPTRDHDLLEAVRGRGRSRARRAGASTSARGFERGLVVSPAATRQP